MPTVCRMMVAALIPPVFRRLMIRGGGALRW